MGNFQLALPDFAFQTTWARKKYFLVQHESPCPSGKQSLMWGPHKPKRVGEHSKIQQPSTTFFSVVNRFFLILGKIRRFAIAALENFRNPKSPFFNRRSMIQQAPDGGENSESVNAGATESPAQSGTEGKIVPDLGPWSNRPSEAMQIWMILLFLFFLTSVHNHQTSQKLLFHQQQNRGNSCFISANKTRQSGQIMTIWSKCALPMHSRKKRVSIKKRTVYT